MTLCVITSAPCHLFVTPCPYTLSYSPSKQQLASPQKNKTVFQLPAASRTALALILRKSKETFEVEVESRTSKTKETRFPQHDEYLFSSPSVSVVLEKSGCCNAVTCSSIPASRPCKRGEWKRPYISIYIYNIIHRSMNSLLFSLLFRLFGDRCRFFRVFFRFLFVWSILLLIVRRTFFPSGWCFFYLVTTGWIFDITLLCENSFNQSINERRRWLQNCDILRNIVPVRKPGGVCLFLAVYLKMWPTLDASSLAQGLHHNHRPRYINFPYFCTMCGL